MIVTAAGAAVGIFLLLDRSVRSHDEAHCQTERAYFLRRVGRGGADWHAVPSGIARGRALIPGTVALTPAGLVWDGLWGRSGSYSFEEIQRLETDERTQAQRGFFRSKVLRVTATSGEVVEFVRLPRPRVGVAAGARGVGGEPRRGSRAPPRAESLRSVLLRQERHRPRREAGGRRRAIALRMSSGGRPERQVREDDDLVLEEVRPLGDLVEVEVLPLLRALVVALLDERALEEQDLRREERARRAREDPVARVARVGDERESRPSPRRPRPAPRRLGSLPRGAPASSARRRLRISDATKRERRDAVVGLESLDLEIAPEARRACRAPSPRRARRTARPRGPAWSARIFVHAGTPAGCVRTAPPGSRRSRRCEHQYARPAPWSRCGVREEDVRHRDELRGRAPEVEREMQRREVEPRLASRHRDAPDGQARPRGLDPPLPSLGTHGRRIRRASYNSDRVPGKARRRTRWPCSTMPRRS